MKTDKKKNTETEISDDAKIAAWIARFQWLKHFLGVKKVLPNIINRQIMNATCQYSRRRWFWQQDKFGRIIMIFTKDGVFLGQVGKSTVPTLARMGTYIKETEEEHLFEESIEEALRRLDPDGKKAHFTVGTDTDENHKTLFFTQPLEGKTIQETLKIEQGRAEAELTETLKEISTPPAESVMRN